MSTSSLLLAIAILFGAGDIGLSNAFGVNHARRHSLASTTQIFSSGVGPAEDDGPTKGKSSSTMTVKFSGETSIISDAVNVDSNKPLHDFFALPDAVLSIMRGSKNNQVDELEMVDTESFELYEQNCQMWNVSSASLDDRIFEVTTSGVQFPGLQVMSVVTFGLKTIITTDYPSFQLVLFRDTTYAKGNRLFVWFFNKVTGKGKANEDEPTPGTEQTTFNINTISVIPKENDMVSFESQAELGLQVKFPSILIKAIPGLTKEKMEISGSESIQKALDQDVPPGLEGFRQEYLRWLQS